MSYLGIGIKYVLTIILRVSRIHSKAVLYRTNSTWQVGIHMVFQQTYFDNLCPNLKQNDPGISLSDKMTVPIGDFGTLGGSRLTREISIVYVVLSVRT